MCVVVEVVVVVVVVVGPQRMQSTKMRPVATHVVWSVCLSVCWTQW